jgi:heme-degrading monooxygenase HmoA
MYGTIAKLNAKPGAVEELSKMGTGRIAAGYVGSYVYKSDKEPNELWLVAIFNDRDSYNANANSPEQDVEFRSLMQFFKSEPEWHDGEIVFEHRLGQ